MGEPEPTVRVPDSALSGVLGMTCNDAVNGGPRIADLTGLVRLPNLAQLDPTAHRGHRPHPLAALPQLLGVDLSGSDSTGIAGIEELRTRGIYVGGLA
jgi:hypothetical protein